VIVDDDKARAGESTDAGPTGGGLGGQQPCDEACDEPRDQACDERGGDDVLGEPNTDAALRRVRDLLAEHVPLALIADLTVDVSPLAAGLVEGEHDARGAKGGPPHTSGGPETRRRA